MKRSHNFRGFSLVEVMVGLVIGMLGILVIMQVFAVSEGQKRTTTGGVDAQANGIAALSAIDRDARQAGYGYTTFPGLPINPLLGCPIRAYNQNAVNPVPGPGGSNIAFRLYPVLITDGGGGLPDTVTITYGTSTGLSAPVTLTGTRPAPATSVSAPPTGVHFGDLVVTVETGKDCTLNQITGPGSYPYPFGPVTDRYPVKGVPVNPPPANTLVHAPGVNGPFNRSGGLGVSYCSTGVPCPSSLVNLGIPVIQSYWISPPNTFAVSDLLLGGAGATNMTALADNIVNLQAQYGVDTNGDNILDLWTDAVGIYTDNNSFAAPSPTGATIATIKSIRVAVVARSTLKEKMNAGVCDATAAAPILWPGPQQVAVDLSAIPDALCYRYRVYETVIPLRNMIWAAS